jgi:hypothetical protein
VFTHRPPLTRQPSSGIVHQTVPFGARLPISLLVPRSSVSVCSLTAACPDRVGVVKRPSLAAGGQLSATVQRSRHNPLPYAHYSLSTFFSYISELFAPFAKLKCFLFSKIRTLCAKHRGWGLFDVLTFRRFDVQTIPVSLLDSVLTHISPPKSFRIRSYAKAPGVCRSLVGNSRVFNRIPRSPDRDLSTHSRALLVAP